MAFLRGEADRARVAVGRRAVRLLGDLGRAANPRYLLRERPSVLILASLGLGLSVAVGARRRAEPGVGRPQVAACAREPFLSGVVRVVRGALISALMTRLLTGSRANGAGAGGPPGRTG